MLTALAIAASLYALPPPVRGDFDRDGKSDLAEIVKSKGIYQVVVHPGGRPNAAVVVETLGSGNSDYFLDKARPGRWTTWCGKGGGSDHAWCPRASVLLKGGELMFGVKEASASVVVWTGKRFEVVLISD